MSASTSTPQTRRSLHPFRLRPVRVLSARHGAAVVDRPASGPLERSASGAPEGSASGAGLERSASGAGSGVPRRSFAARLVLGGAGDPRWARPLLWALMLGTAVLYLADLTNSGYANSFYAAAVKSGTESLKAWLFGSLDAGNSITVDKPPASLWLMVLSARIFGFSSFSLLLPQALLGVGTVALTHATVRRWAGQAAGLIAGAVLALTPVAALMFRYDNPDALLVFLMTLAAYAVVRAVDAGRSDAGLVTLRTGSAAALRWMLIAGAALGFAFLTKMMQGMLVLPALAAVYLVASPLRLRTRIVHTLAAAGSLIVAAGWFIALVAVWPAAARPYIGGSTDNSLWELAIGYNGLQRLISGRSGGGMGGGGNTGFGGEAGLFRMFNTAFGTQISWLLPAALIGLVAGLILLRRTPRTNTARAALLLWGGWLVVSTLVFSFMSGTIHPYYTVALAPAIGAVIGVAATRLWARRDDHVARGALAAMIFAGGVWGCYLMGRDSGGWSSWLRWVMLAGAVIGSGLLVVSTGALKRFAVAAVLVGSLASMGGTAAYTVATVSTGHTGSIPTAGPVVAGAGFGGAGGGGTGGMGGGGTATTSSTSELISMLNDTSTRWSAAVVGDQSAAGYILSSDTAVLPIGGWSGSDDSPTLAQFQEYVATGQVTYFITGGDSRGGMGRGGTDSVGSQITAWVTANFTATTVDGVTVYDLTAN